MIKTFLPFFAIIFISCSGGSVPSGMLEPDELYPVVKDIMITDEYLNNFILKDSTVDVKKRRSELYQQVFTLHNTNKDQFYKSFKYYQQHPDLQKVLFDSLAEGLKKKEISKITAIKDSL